VGNSVARGGPGTTWYNGAKHIPIDRNKTYRVRCWARESSGADGTFYMGVALFDENENNISGDGTQWYYAASSVSLSTIWTEYTGACGPGTAKTFPANARTMKPLFILSDNGTTGFHEIQDLRIEEMLPSTLIQDGAVVTDKLYALAVTGAKIAAGAVETNKLAALAVTAAKIAANTITSDKIATNTLEALFAKVAYALTIGYGGTGEAGDPDTGDRRVYIDDDELAIQRYGGASWVDRIRLGYQVMKAYDENAVVIHDIPNVAIASDMVYGGHIIWKDAPDYFGARTLSLTDSSTGHIWPQSKVDSSLASDIPDGLTNVKGAVLAVLSAAYVDAAKTKENAWALVQTKYSVDYDEMPTTYNVMAKLQTFCSGAFASGYWNPSIFTHALVPVVYSGNTPYVTWSLEGTIAGLNAGNGETDTYSIRSYLYILGFIV
jgi:hypothetical protein